MMDRKTEEYQTLSDMTGVPVGEIDMALSFWDILYNKPKSLLEHTRNGN